MFRCFLCTLQPVILFYVQCRLHNNILQNLQKAMLSFIYSIFFQTNITASSRINIVNVTSSKSDLRTDP